MELPADCAGDSRDAAFESSYQGKDGLLDLQLPLSQPRSYKQPLTQSPLSNPINSLID